MAFNSVRSAPDLVPLRNVLVSTYDKTGLAEFVACLAELESECRFIATEGSRETLATVLGAEAEGRLVSVSVYTGQPEMAGGLVKTLDWKIYLGLLAETGDLRHEADLERSGALRFDLVVANLYPFSRAASRPGIGPEELRQHIDIGGQAMLRAAAKNYLRVAAVSDPGQYPALMEELRKEGGLLLATRARLAVETFAACSRFDAAVSSGLASLGLSELRAAYRGPDA